MQTKPADSGKELLIKFKGAGSRFTVDTIDYLNEEYIYVIKTYKNKLKYRFLTEEEKENVKQRRADMLRKKVRELKLKKFKEAHPEVYIEYVSFLDELEVIRSRRLKRSFESSHLGLLFGILPTRSFFSGEIERKDADQIDLNKCVDLQEKINTIEREINGTSVLMSELRES